jgi:NADH:ubiquinone oxidoreductase subunit 6 (subunit J)
MNQTLHIFRKDARHHWPEILLSLVLLILYCWKEVREEYPERFYSSLSIIPWLEFVPILLPVAWFLLIVRLVQDESLVGDRQWWVTKPYQWPSLLTAKLLSFSVWFCVPVFFAQCFLLRAAGFAVTPHFAGLLYNQFGIISVVLAACFLIACLTRNLGHAIIALIGLFLLMTGFSSFERFEPNPALQPIQSVSDMLSGIVAVTASLAVVLWQFARRKTVHTRSVFLAAIAATWVIQLATPYHALMEKKYPVASVQDQPFRMALRSEPLGKPANPPQKDPKNIFLRIPVEVSGISPGNFVTVDAQQLTVEDSTGAKWQEEWTGGSGQWWPENHSIWSMLSVKNSVYQKLKSEPVKVRLEMAVREYHLEDPREFRVQEGEFRVPTLGICGTRIPLRTDLICRSPFVAPPFVATFDPASAKCPMEPDKTLQGSSPLRSANLGEFGQRSLISPIATSNIHFFSYLPSLSPLNPPKSQNICPGDTIGLSTPVVSRHVRVEVLLEPVKMEEFRVVPAQFVESVTVGTF